MDWRDVYRYFMFECEKDFKKMPAALFESVNNETMEKLHLYATDFQQKLYCTI